MVDLLFDINARDLQVVNGDFVTTDDASVQNASIIKEARVFSPNNPAFGVGLMESINAPVPGLNYEMNRVMDQIRQDGATIARFTITNKNRISNIEMEVKY